MKLLIALVQASGEDMILSAIQLLRVALVTRLLLLISLMIITTLVSLIALIAMWRFPRAARGGHPPNALHVSHGACVETSDSRAA